MPALADNVKAFQALKTDLYQKDFLLTWEHAEEEIKAILALAEALKLIHQEGLSYRAFDTGLAISIFRDNSTTVAALEHLKELEDLVYLDGLTRIANRTYLETFIVAKFNELRRLGWSFGVIFVDVDQFKPVNDTFGHQTGDLVLKMVAQTLLKNCRSFDLVGRWC